MKGITWGDLMIDTNKYKGHTPAPWKLHYDDSAIGGAHLDYGAQLDPVGALHAMSVANARLIADAPLLLAEVKQLRAWKKLVSDIVQQQDGSHLREMLKELIE